MCAEKKRFQTWDNLFPDLKKSFLSKRISGEVNPFRKTFNIKINKNLFFKTFCAGDSNLHLNVACQSFNQEIYKALEPFVFEYTSKLKGSVSAEHGIGFHKTKYLKYSKSSEAVAFMKQ